MVALMRRSRSAFTLVELMIVVVIVAILALVAIPLYRGNVEAAKFSEGIAGCGAIRTAVQVYLAAHNNTLTGDETLDIIGVNAADLEGKYFKQSASAYTFSPEAGTSYKISATLGDKIYEIDQDGTETPGEGYYTTGN